MPLTIPRAGIDAGRAANMAGQPLQIDPAAEAMAKLGDVITQRASAWQAENDAMILNRMNVDMARDMGRAQLELSQSNDPNIDQLWQAKSAEIRAKYLNAPNLHTGLREKATMVFDNMATRHELAIGQQAIALRNSYREANWMTQRETSMAEAASAPQETLDDLLMAGENAIRTKGQANGTPPDQIEAEVQTYVKDIMLSRAKGDIARDPEAFLANADQYQSLGAVQADLILDAEVAIAARREKEAKAQEQAIKEQQTAIGDALKDGMASFALGRQWTGEVDDKDPAVTNHPLYPQYAAAKGLRDDKITIGLKTPDELQALIEAERAKPIGSAWQNDRLKLLQDTLEATKTAWAKNSVDAAKAAGLLPADDVLQFDPANPQAFAAGLAKRMMFDDTVRPKYTRFGQGLFGSDEAPALQAIMAPEKDAAPKVALLQSLAVQRAPAAQVDAALAAIGGGAVEKRALRLLRDTGDAALVERVLRGQQQVKLGVVSLPPEKARQMIFAEATGRVFDDSPQLAQQIMESASAVYAAEAAGVNPDGDNSIIPFASDTAAQDMFRAAVQRVTGVASDANGEPVIGGLQEVNGAKVVLPQGVHRSEVEEALDNATYQLRGMQFNAVSKAWVNPALDEYTSDAGRYAAAQPGDDRFTGTDLANARADGTAPYAASEPLDDTYALNGNRTAQAKAATKPDADPYRAFRAASAVVPNARPQLGRNPAAALQDVQFKRLGETDYYQMIWNGSVVLDEDGVEYRMKLTDFLKGAQQ